MTSTDICCRKKQAIFTICDAEYAGMSLCMFESASEFYQDTDFFLFVIGTGQVSKLDGNINVIYIAELLDDLDLSQRLAYYLQVELTTSVRPHCFEYILAEGYDRAIYLDPDIYVFRRMTEVDDLLSGNVNGVVTPHALQSTGSANVFGGDQVFLQCGIFNLGFLALKNTPETKRMLSWWKGKLKWKCIIDWPNGYFVDQKWLEFLPVFFEGFHILRLPTYNLAPWNSEHYKILTDSRGRFFVDNFKAPVAFIHYSGVKRSESHFLHMKAAYRFYREKLDKKKFMKLGFVNYEVRFKPSNLYLDRVCSCIYKDYVNKTNDTTSNPLKDRGFYDYLHGIDAETNFPVYIRKLFEVMPDIFVGYLNANVAINFDSLIAIMKDHFSYSGVASPETMVQLRNDGLRVDYAFSKTDSNVGGTISTEPFHQRAIVVGEPSYQDAILSFCSRQHSRGRRDAKSSDRQVIVKSDRTEIVSGVVRIGIPQMDETGSLSSAFASEASEYTEIWVPGSFCKERVVEAHGLANVTPIPYCVPKPKVQIEAVDLPSNKLIVLMRHDFNLGFAAQNPLASISAFKKALSKRNDVLLVCFVANTTKDANSYKRLVAALGEEKNTMIVDGASDVNSYYSYLHRAHCFISLHEEMAVCYALAEAMALGKCVIATGNGGSAGFMNLSNSFLIDSALDTGNVIEAAKVLASIYKDTSVLTTKGREARLHIQRHLSAPVIGLVMLNRIEELHGLKRSEELIRLTEDQSKARPNIVRRLESALRARLRKHPAMVRAYLRVRGRQPHQIAPVSHEPNPQIAAVMKILLKNVQRPAILE